MSNPGRCSVDICYVTGYKYPPVIGFDFKEFAILLTHDYHENVEFFTYYQDKREYYKYAKDIRRQLGRFKGKVEYFSFLLPIETVREIYETFKDHSNIPYEHLFGLLEACIPRDILPLYFRV